MSFYTPFSISNIQFQFHYVVYQLFKKQSDILCRAHGSLIRGQWRRASYITKWWHSFVLICDHGFFEQMLQLCLKMQLEQRCTVPLKSKSPICIITTVNIRSIAHAHTNGPPLVLWQSQINPCHLYSLCKSPPPLLTLLQLRAHGHLRGCLRYTQNGYLHLNGRFITKKIWILLFFSGTPTKPELLCHSES